MSTGQLRNSAHTGCLILSIDELYDAGLSAGAIGGKLVGAGGGGFLLFVTKQPHQLRLKMQNLNVQEVPFAFDNEGTVVIASD